MSPARSLPRFFGSPVAYLFIGAFLAATLFIFFWVETFFARNIADVRPLFEWMPLLLIFLVAALTMRAVERGAPRRDPGDPADPAGAAARAWCWASSSPPWPWWRWPWP